MDLTLAACGVYIYRHMERSDDRFQGDAAEQLIDQLEHESVFSLERWRREIVVMLDHWLYLSEEMTQLDGVAKSSSAEERQAIAMQLLARARQYIQDESILLEPRLGLRPPVVVQGELLWYRHTGLGTLNVQKLADNCEIRGHYFGCDVAMYHAAEAINLPDYQRDAYRRSIGAHMVIFKPLICDSASGEVVDANAYFALVPLHYENTTFEALHVDA